MGNLAFRKTNGDVDIDKYIELGEFWISNWNSAPGRLKKSLADKLYNLGASNEDGDVVDDPDSRSTPPRGKVKIDLASDAGRKHAHIVQPSEMSNLDYLVAQADAVCALTDNEKKKKALIGLYLLGRCR